MSKQTAVEWLAERIQSDKIFSLKNVIEQAKAMEKQQIIDAFGVGCHHESKRLVGYQDVAEQYYEQTYGKEAGHE